MPAQISFIIGNEACERFSFYGMRNILTPFLVTGRCCFTRRESLARSIRKRRSKVCVRCCES